MSEPFLAEIRMMGFNFPPRGWAFCDGQIVPIDQNQSLYSLLGTTYGGDGRTTFALPDLRGRTPIHEGTRPGGQTHQLGSRAGQESHMLTAQELPQHQHTVQASSDGADEDEPSGERVLARPREDIYSDATNAVQMATGAVGNAGLDQAHENMQPYATLNFCIALQGVFPSRN